MGPFQTPWRQIPYDERFEILDIVLTFERTFVVHSKCKNKVEEDEFYIVLLKKITSHCSLRYYGSVALCHLYDASLFYW